MRIRRPRDHAPRAFTLIEIMIVVGILAIIVAIAAPAWIRARSQSRMKTCQENLTKIDGSKEQYALEHRRRAGDPVAVSDIVNANPTSGYLNSIPPEPSGYTYVLGVIGEEPSCTSGQPGHDFSSIGLTVTEVEK
jgi:prepilin-type N-terminal cleavage/methylation domain-containing protein